MGNMSIDELFNYLSAFKGFFGFFKHAKKGFWMIELITAMAILTGMMLILTRFGWNIMLAEQDAVKRMEAISCVSALIDEKSKKVRKSAFKGKKFGDFTLNCKIYSAKVLGSNFPESVKNGFKNGFGVFERADITVSFASDFGAKREFRILTSLLVDLGRGVN